VRGLRASRHASRQAASTSLPPAGKSHKAGGNVLRYEVKTPDKIDVPLLERRLLRLAAGGQLMN